MDETLWTLTTIVGPLILLGLLLWLALRGRSNRTDARTEQGTEDAYAAEEQKRRDGTDGL